jgi:phospholipid transport system substrate-binding protein
MLARRALLVGLLVPSAVMAQDGPAGPIAAFNAALQRGMKAGQATAFAARAAMLRPAVERAFDLPAILAASVGPRFAGFAEAAKAELLEAFTVFTVATWVANFDADAGERFEVAAETRALGQDQVVTSRIVPASGDTTRLDFVMRQGPQGWKAVDILLNGTISRVAVQRSDFRALVAGGDPAPLLASLRSRAASLAAGAKS